MQTEVDAEEQSLQAFQEKKEGGSLEGDKAQVYGIIQDQGPITCRQVADIMGKYPHQISGRFTELRDQDWIHETGVEDGHTLWDVKPLFIEEETGEKESGGEDVIWKGDKA